MPPFQPIIETGAYTLRPPDPADIPWIFNACQDPEIGRWTEIPQPYLAEHAVAFVENRLEELWSYMITRTESGELLGAIGLKGLDPRTGRAEIGYWLAPEARGEGVVVVALEGLERTAAGDLGAREAVLRIADGNAASLAVARRAGYTLTDRLPGGCKGADALVFTKRLGPPAT
jgi:RimJ/RimL family protein N-acetyltransferase